MSPAERGGGDPIRDAARRAAGRTEAPRRSAASPPEPEALWPEAGGDGGRGGGERTFGAWLEGLIPPEAQVHFANAGRELVAGIEVTLDHHLGRRPESRADRGPVRIEIE